MLVLRYNKVCSIVLLHTVYPADVAKCHSGSLFRYHTYLYCAWYAGSLHGNVVVRASTLDEPLIGP